MLRQGLTFNTTGRGYEVIETYFDNHTLESVRAYYATALNRSGWSLLTAPADLGLSFRRTRHPAESGEMLFRPNAVGVTVRITYDYS